MGRKQFIHLVEKFEMMREDSRLSTDVVLMEDVNDVGEYEHL
jgi:hypothetical protein